MTWTDTDGSSSATGRDGTRWRISGAGKHYAIYVADWDHPDWYTDTLNDAKRLCNELDRRPKFWSELTTTESIYMR
jgi:hypothetical protein